MYRRIFLFLLLFSLAYIPSAMPQTDAAAFPKQEPGTRPPILTGTATLSEQELKDGWILLFDGVSTYGWSSDHEDFSVKDGSLRIGKSGGDPILDTRTLRCNTPFYYTDKPFFEYFENGEWKDLIGQLTNGPVPTLELKITLWNGQYRNIKLQPQETKSLFDGKTLNGWKLQGQAKAAVEDGTIRLTNGSGSLESEGQYGNFILQLEYKTDKPVNSGVFFRCIPGELMNGYECQIFNNPPADDYKKFIGTDTGGIFRRQVGRKVEAKDGQWNYLTVVVCDNQISTWVNGIQVSDWKDTRKADANPRRGYRAEAGTIQFQGHDPSTDILLRNIRIRTQIKKRD